jgi:hypothetical protein
MGGGSEQAVSSAASGAAAGSVAGPWGAAIGGAVGLIGGIESGNEASNYQKQQQAALAADQAKRDAYVAQQQALYAPTQQKLLEESANPTPLNYGANLGQINKQTLGGEQRLDATMAAHGMTGSGLQGAGMQGLEMGRVGELSSAFNTGLNARTSLGMNLLQHYNPLGNAQFGEGALPQQMQFGASQQAMANTAMQQGMGAFGKGLAGVMNGMGQPTQGQQYNPNAVLQDNVVNGMNANPSQMSNDEAMAQQMPGGMPPGLQLPNNGQIMPDNWTMNQSGQNQTMGQVPAETPDLSGLGAFNMGF